MYYMKMFTEKGTPHEKWRPTIFSFFTSNYKIKCPGCGETFKAHIPEIPKVGEEGEINCNGCGYTLTYK